MKEMPDLADIIRNTDCAYLDEHFAWRADPAAIADQLHAALRAEVLDEQGPGDQETLEEAAQMYRNLRDAIVETMADPSQWDGDGDEGSILANYVRWLAAGKPDEDPEGFFQVGRTYSEPGDTTDWRFRCDAITTHPETGERTALGWKHFHGQWSECAYPESEWEIHQIADALATTARPLPAVGVTDTNRRARLLHEMALGARWKSGDVVAWYQTQGLTGLGTRAARHDLAVLRDSGAITQHDEKGVRFYTRATHNTNTGNPA